MARYYKSRYLADPVVYVQEDGRWCSYAPAGVIRQAPGAVPESILTQIEEIEEAEAQTLITSRLADAERVEADRAKADTYTRQHAVQAGLRGGLKAAIVWLAFIILHGSMSASVVDRFIMSNLYPSLAEPTSAQYSQAWHPWIVFDVLAAIILSAAPILLILFLVQRRPITRWLMIGFCFFVLAVAAADLVMTISLGPKLSSQSGLVKYAILIWERAVLGVIGAIWGLPFIPYFLWSLRVKKTLVGRPSASVQPQMRPMIPYTPPGGPAYPAAPPAAAYAPMPTPQSAPRPAGECAQCGATLFAEAGYCVKCGAEARRKVMPGLDAATAATHTWLAADAVNAAVRDDLHDLVQLTHVYSSSPERLQEIDYLLQMVAARLDPGKNKSEIAYILGAADAPELLPAIATAQSVLVSLGPKAIDSLEGVALSASETTRQRVDAVLRQIWDATPQSETGAGPIR